VLKKAFFSDSCSDRITLPISNWLFYLEGQTYSAICTFSHS